MRSTRLILSTALAFPLLFLAGCEVGAGAKDQRPDLVDITVTENGEEAEGLATSRYFIIDSITAGAGDCICDQIGNLSRKEFQFNFYVVVPDVLAEYDVDIFSSFLSGGDDGEITIAPRYGVVTSVVKTIINRESGSARGVVRFAGNWLVPEAVLESTPPCEGGDRPYFYNMAFSISDDEGNSDATNFDFIIFDNSWSQCQQSNRCVRPPLGC